MQSMPSYLQRPEQQFFALPYTITKAQMLGLVFQADPQILARHFVDPLFNAATTPGRFQVELDGRFVVGQIRYPLLTHSDPHFGGFSYNESVIYLALRDTGPAPGTPEHYWFTPVMVLDSFLPLIAGREIFGFPKILGEINSNPTTLANLFTTPRGSGTVAVQGFATTSKQELAALQKLWSWRVTGGGPLVEELAAKAVEWVLATHLPNPLGLLDAVRSRLLRFVGRLDPGLFLKEFPAASKPTLACYGSLVRSSFAPTAVHRLVALTAEASFEAPASFPLATQLGFTPGTTQAAELAFLAEMDWQIPAGEEFR